MRKLFLLFATVALTVVCLCVPAFAADECTTHNWTVETGGVCPSCGFVCEHDGSFDAVEVSSYHGNHICIICRSFVPCSDADGDFTCDDCGFYNYALAAGGCECWATMDLYFSGSLRCIAYDTQHYFFCLEHGCPVLLSDLYAWYGDEALEPHSDSCAFSADEIVIPDHHTEVPCPLVVAWFAGVVSDDFLLSCSFAYEDSIHYVVCNDCGAYIDVIGLLGDDSFHTGSECEICAMLSAGGISVIPLSSLLGKSSVSDILEPTTSIFNSTMEMAAVTAETVSSEPLLLFGFVLGFVGLGVGLFRRLRNV